MIIKGPPSQGFPTIFPMTIILISFYSSLLLYQKRPFCLTMPGDVRPVFPRASCIDVWKFSPSYEVGTTWVQFDDPDAFHAFQFTQRNIWGAATLVAPEKKNTTCLGNIPSRNEKLFFFFFGTFCFPTRFR